MALKKRGRKKKQIVESAGKPGRKKELKRFELDTFYTKDNPSLYENQVAFLVTTSGGTPLNQTDVGKLYRLLQHELRSLGHKLKRKGQELDPAPKPEPKKEEAPSAVDSGPALAPGETYTPESADPEPLPNPSLADPDNSDPAN